MNNTNDVKALNMAAVLQCIQRNKSITKSSIAALLSITTVTSHKLVTELCNAGFCGETGEYVSCGGKKAALFSLEKDYCIILGCAIMRKTVRFSATDFALCDIYSETVSIDMSDVDGTLEKILAGIDKMLLLFKNKKTIAGIGITIPGRRLKKTGGIDLPDFPGWDGIKLDKIVKARSQLPVFLDNDANALALSVKWNGESSGISDFVCLQVKDGFGVGLVIGNELFRGSRNKGCEFGHITLDPNGKLCKCGKRGCLQTYINEEQVLDNIGRHLNKKISVNDLEALIKNGEDYVRKTVTEYLNNLHFAVDSIISTFDPEAVFLLNDLAHASRLYESKLQKNYFGIGDDRPPVIIISDPHTYDAAPACVVYEQIMNSPMNFIINQ